MSLNSKEKTSKHIKQRLRSSQLTAVISISLVLFLLGLVGTMILFAGKISNYVKENIGFSIILKENIKEIDSFRLQKDLDASIFIKSTDYITRERAAEEFQEALGENFVDFLGYNPLLASIEVKLYADYANPDSLVMIKSRLAEYDQIKEVYYQENLVDLLNNNIQRISVYLMIFSALLMLVSIVLINNTVRLTIYARRFLINTMKLVGATHSFIRRPFLLQSMGQGILGSLVAIVLLSFVLKALESEFTAIISFKDYELIGVLFAGIILLGILLSLLAAYFASTKYLRMKTDQLFN